MLTDAKVKSLKPLPGKNITKISDGKGSGLRYWVKPNGTTMALFEYRFNGKRKTLALGVLYKNITLAEARAKCYQAKLQLKDGIDPCAHKKAVKQARYYAAENSFEILALEWFSNRGKKSESSDKRIKRLLERDLIPQLGKRPIKEITPAELLQVLRKIEDRGVIETARRAKQYVGQIFQYAIATSRAEHDITANLKKALKTPVKSHFAAITDPKALGKLMLAIRNFDGTPVVKAALELSALLVCRPGELRHMEWSEVNWDEKRIELPAKKMKMKQDHIIPLSSQALNILTELRLHTGRGKYIFPNARGASRPMSENGVRTALRTLGFTNDEMTVHGFRATFRTLADEVLEMPVAWIEHQLAHIVKDTNGTAYNRTKHLPQRREMMEKWGGYLYGLKAT